MSKRKKRQNKEQPKGEVVRVVAIFDPAFREDLIWWARTRLEIFERVLNLIEATLQDPFVGIGKPELLKYLASDIWSRRITQEHRLLYKVTSERIYFLQARFHY